MCQCHHGLVKTLQLFLFNFISNMRVFRKQSLFNWHLYYDFLQKGYQNQWESSFFKNLYQSLRTQSSQIISHASIDETFWFRLRLSNMWRQFAHAPIQYSFCIHLFVYGIKSMVRQHFVTPAVDAFLRQQITPRVQRPLYS